MTEGSHRRSVVDVVEIIWSALAQSNARAARYQAALMLIAAERRSDGTYNRDREACGDLARAVLKEDSA